MPWEGRLEGLGAPGEHSSTEGYATGQTCRDHRQMRSCPVRPRALSPLLSPQRVLGLAVPRQDSCSVSYREGTRKGASEKG